MQASIKLKNRSPCSVVRSLIISCLQMLSAPLNKRTAPSSNSFSLFVTSFEKMKFCCRQCFFLSSYPPFDLRITVALLLLLFSFFLVVHLLKYF